MKILVAVKRVIDYEVDIQINEACTDVIQSGVPMSINPYDEVALEEAIRLKEAGIASHVIAVSLGDVNSKDVLKTSLAMGADEALLIESAEKFESLTVAKVIAKLALEHNADLVFFGQQSIDSDAHQTGQMTAALLHCGQAVCVSQLSVDTDNRTITAVSDGDLGSKNLKLSLPAVITAALRLNQPRFIGLPQIMKAKRKTIIVKAFADLGLGEQPKRTLEIISVKAPESRAPVIMLDDVDSLVRVIHIATQKL